MIFYAIVLFIFARVKCWSLNKLANEDIHIGPEGKDVDGCGKLKNPCYTMRYALLTFSGSNLFLNVEGPRAFEFLSGPIDIKHNVTIRPFNSEHVSIENCGNISGLFNFMGIGSESYVSVTLNRVNIFNCSSRGLMSTSNTRLSIVNSTFNSNGILLKHKRLSKNCSNVHVTITGSKFVDNFNLNPFGPSISLCGCENITMRVSNSYFDSSPILLESSHHNIMFTNVTFKSSFRVTYFFQAQSSGSANVVFFHRCSFATVARVNSSPLLILTSRVNVGMQSTVTFQYSNFSSSSIVSGAAIYVGSVVQGSNWTNTKVIVRYCVFSHCSSKADGGAIHAKSLKTLTVNGCSFLNNSAANGGALYVDNVENVQITNSDFNFNRAEIDRVYASRGGAVYAVNSNFDVGNSTFGDNVANYEGHSLYSLDGRDIRLAASTFALNRPDDEPACAEALVVSRCYGYGCSHANITKVTLLYNHTGLRTRGDVALMTAEGRISTENLDENCPSDYTAERSSVASGSASFQYKLISVWCRMKHS